MWNELILLIKAQATICQQLIALGERQRECLLGNDRQPVYELMKEQENTFHRFTQLEHKKQRLLQENGQQADFLPGVPEVRRSEIVPYFAILQDRMQILRGLNQGNQTLLDNEVRFIEFNVNLMTQTTADDIYAPQGQSGSVISKKKMFDQTI